MQVEEPAKLQVEEFKANYAHICAKELLESLVKLHIGPLDESTHHEYEAPFNNDLGYKFWL